MKCAAATHTERDTACSCVCALPWPDRAGTVQRASVSAHAGEGKSERPKQSSSDQFQGRKTFNCMQMTERGKDICVVATPTEPRLAPLNGADTTQSIHFSAHAAADAWHDLPHPKGAIERTATQVRIL